MPKTVLSDDKSFFLQQKIKNNFFYADESKKILEMKNDVELCIICSDFSANDINAIKKTKAKNPNIEFWICTEALSKKNITIANKIGINTVISSPMAMHMVEDFFISKYSLEMEKTDYIDNFITGIENSKVMIVDDNKMNIELLEETLSKLKLDISSFIKSKDALQAAGNAKFDLLLLDVMMPEMSGFELARKIKENPAYGNVPIIFISALSDSHNKIEGFNIGSYAFVEKPFDVNVLRSQIFNLLKNQKKQAVENAQKESFLATVAHDLKTPINAGIGALNLLLNEQLGELDELQHEIVQDLLNSTRFMQDMVENILCKSKIENKKMSLSKQVYSLKNLMEHCIELTKYILSEKKQKIKLECLCENTLVPLDFLEMKRAIHNLIANASEYSPSYGEIYIKIFKNDGYIGFSIQDFGKGIKLSNQQDVFGQYMTMAKEHKRVGTGLGLYITKQIVEAHDGEIALVSELGKGTTFTVMLPMYDKN